jgi:hypothetical protein
MTLDKIARLLAGAVLTTSMFAVSVPAPAIAQRPVPVVNVPCCRCLDGRALTADISTGNAPWMVAPPVGVTTAAVPVASPPASWTTSLAPAKWVNHPTAGMATGFYSYTLRIVVPKCTIPARVTIAGSLATDNQGQLVLGSSVPALNVASPSFTTPTAFGTASLGSGTHILTVRVRNNELQTGLVLRGAVTVRCPLEHGPVDDVGTSPVDPTGS